MLIFEILIFIQKMFLSFPKGAKSFLISFVVCAAICMGYYLNTLTKTDGHYIYLIDDAYIHLAIAKNFAFHKVWGITRYAFSSTSSSPMFTYLISRFISALGNNDQIPLYFNAVCFAGVIFFLNSWFTRFFSQVKTVVIVTLFTVLFAVLHLQVMSGMEHIFHVLLLIINIFCFCNPHHNPYRTLGFYGSLMLMGVVRFESMFYFAILSFLFALSGKWKQSVAVIMAGFIPVLIFCVWNYRQDGHFFPNSILVKGTKLSFDSGLFVQLKTMLVDNFLCNISFYKTGFLPIILVIVIIIKDMRNKKMKEILSGRFLLIALSLLMICHTLFADLKGVFRYEAYLLVGFSMLLIPELKGFFRDFRNQKLIALLVLGNVVLLVYKTGYAHLMLINGGKNIYEQQVQSARFLHTYYNTSKIIANDIGAISYYTDIHLLDIAGLGSKETIPFNENKRQFDETFKNFLIRYGYDNHYDLAIVYDEWLQGHIPENWKKAAVIKISHKITAARAEVSVYSIDPHRFSLLQERIRQFPWNKNVQVLLMDENVRKIK
ncbi:hypothetical protein QE441_001750 [Chryseobacterium sp. SORGH_AS909]|uniref:Glycosyltransferase RgtA/B/C/D-like domain-containing protein n=2 Tax=Chryseobacterium group TaxID=2782232 RepID=A0ABU0TQQ8_9FLAO|nr:hypothetical protein [Chryseobacterium camelliae]MDQ1102522.1 hypothetical protein [Chryseobacterium sp. SORGH_AS_1048]MDR6085956.1 hypothetical protein [Chryseobacterium sp. SORGH_AS_0909]MDT3407549.1 hypothetical protein [Pseudacidovorax intermedius]